MAENDTAPAPAPAPPAAVLSPETTNGFLNRALDATPKWAMGIIGTMVGSAIALVAILYLGGLSAPASRIANAYAVAIEKSVDGAAPAAQPSAVSSATTLAASEQAFSAALHSLADKDRHDSVVLGKLMERQWQIDQMLADIDARVKAIETQHKLGKH